MTKAEKFINWVTQTRPDFTKFAPEDTVAEFDPKARFEFDWDESGDPYGETVTAEFCDGSTLTFNYKGEIQ